MITEHILLCKDPNSTWKTKAPDLRQQDTPGPSVETRKGSSGPAIAPLTVEVHTFSPDTQAYCKRWSSDRG